MFGIKLNILSNLIKRDSERRINKFYHNSNSNFLTVDRFSEFARMVCNEREGEGTVESLRRGVCRQNKRSAVADLFEEQYR